MHLIEVLASVNLKCKEEPKRFKVGSRQHCIAIKRLKVAMVLIRWSQDKLRNAKTAIKTANAFGLECDVTPEGAG